MINIKDVAPDIVVEMRYATKNNFTGKVLYPAGECLLVEPAARRLAAVQKKLKAEGLGLKVWDCYRPVSVQKELWALVPDPRYVANPIMGSKHNRGASVDLTLIDKNGNELVMPTPFDEFTEKAHRDFMDLPEEALKNRARLESAMQAEGFIGLPTEWWHFDDPEWTRFALRDEPLTSPTLAADRAPTGPVPPLPDNVGQLVIVTSKDWAAPTGQLQRYEKKNGHWHKAGPVWPVSLGAHGLAWGSGRHNSDQKGPVKAEGDKTGPAGLFPIGTAYGPAAKPPTTAWPYQSVDERWICVDDPASARYNQIFAVDAGATKTWSSAETMKRNDHVYTWVVNIEQNYPDVKAGCGSCIFFHVWRRENAPTEGCTAMSEAHIIELISWLKPSAHPMLLQLPQEAYRDLKDFWNK